MEPVKFIKTFLKLDFDLSFAIGFYPYSGNLHSEDRSFFLRKYPDLLITVHILHVLLQNELKITYVRLGVFFEDDVHRAVPLHIISNISLDSGSISRFIQV